MRQFTKYPTSIMASEVRGVDKCPYCQSKLPTLQELKESGEFGEVYFPKDNKTYKYFECPGCGGKTVYDAN